MTLNPTTQFIVEALIKYGPGLAKELVAIFQKADPTPDDWDKVFATALNKSYDDYVNEAKNK